jgi:hypothetical protein
VDEMTDTGFGWLTSEFREHVARVMKERGASPFEAARYFRLPEAAQLAAVRYLEDRRDIPLRELLAILEERAEV